jgi:hypothetical protein
VNGFVWPSDAAFEVQLAGEECLFKLLFNQVPVFGNDVGEKDFGSPFGLKGLIAKYLVVFEIPD